VKPRVLHTMTWLAPGGGVDKNVYLSIEGMRDRYDFDLVVGTEIHRNDFAGMEGVRVLVCPHLVRKVSPVRDMLALVWLARLIRREKYDLIHTHEAKASLLTRLAGRLAGHRRILYGLHGVTFNDPMSPRKRRVYQGIERNTARAADHIVSVSRDAIEEYHKAGIALGIPWSVVYSGVDVQRFQAEARESDAEAVRKTLGLPVGATVLINIGRFSPAKAQRSAISAFAELGDSAGEPYLVLVGEGPERDACMELARTLGVEERVVFPGFREDVPALLAASDVHVITSQREGLPRVAVEASLVGVPTVGFQVEGLGEVVEDGISGRIVESGDVRALSAALAEVLADPKLGARMGVAARSFAVPRWDHHVMVRELDRTYQNMLTEAG